MFPQTFTSESVCAGHADKICDQISDSVLDAAYSLDPFSRVAIETLVTKNLVVLVGELTTTANINYSQIAKQVIVRLGYTHPDYGFSDNSKQIIQIHAQSPEISQGVDDEGAGDQGMMFGYACNQTSVLMPLPILMAHQITKRIDHCRENQIIPYLRPDGKAQVTIRYDHGQPVGVNTIVVAVPHHESISNRELTHDIYKHVILPIINVYGFKYNQSDLIVNGTGAWYIPGPASDSGLTGRKIVVDTYGGYARVGGGAFSGKDVTKVDRSGAYAARYLAKNIVAAGLATECEISLAYYIGAKKPVAVNINCFDTAKKTQKVIEDFASKLLDLSVRGIIEGLNLRRPIYKPTAAYGHFGRPEFPWEKTRTDI